MSGGGKSKSLLFLHLMSMMSWFQEEDEHEHVDNDDITNLSL